MMLLLSAINSVNDDYIRKKPRSRAYFAYTSVTRLVNASLVVK